MKRGGQNVRFLANKSLYLSNGIGPTLLLIINRNSYTGSQLAPNSITLNDLERQNMGFYGFFGDFGLRHKFIIHRVAPRNTLCYGRCIHIHGSK